MKQEHLEQYSKAVAAVAAQKVKNIYLVACGGSKAFMHPSQYIFDMETEIPAAVYSSNEFVHRCPKGLGANSLVITCSHSGNTPETVRATALAREKGALTIALSNLVGSPLWETAEYAVHYDWKDCDVSDSRYGLMYAITFGVLNALAPCEKYERALQAVNALQPSIDRAREMHQKRADVFGKLHKRDKLIYTMASGSNYGSAYSFAICLLMEMSWVHSNAIHAGEYFHGPFECTDFDVPFLLLKGVDACRPLDERAETFCKKYSERVTVIDAADFDMHEIPEELRCYFAAVVTDYVLRDYAEALADHRGHPLTVRRYMWRMEY